MKLDEPRQIEQALATQKREVEVLYWLVEDSLHQGNKRKAESILILLLYIGKYKPEMITSGLHFIQRERLKEITHELLNNVTTQKREAITIRPAIQPKEIRFSKEKELQEYLAHNKEILEKAFNDRLRIIGIEVETEDNYRCDIVAESPKKFYPIELKIYQGNHAVVSQCSKYCYYFYRKLRYDRFKIVQGVVILNGADAWSINELRRCGHWVYVINPISDTNIFLEKIN